MAELDHFSSMIRQRVRESQRNINLYGRQNHILDDFMVKRTKDELHPHQGGQSKVERFWSGSGGLKFRGSEEGFPDLNQASRYDRNGSAGSANGLDPKSALDAEAQMPINDINMAPAQAHAPAQQAHAEVKVKVEEQPQVKSAFASGSSYSYDYGSDAEMPDAPKSEPAEPAKPAKIPLKKKASAHEPSASSSSGHKVKIIVDGKSYRTFTDLKSDLGLTHIPKNWSVQSKAGNKVEWEWKGHKMKLV